MINLPLIGVSALFYIALASVLYLLSWLIATVILRLFRTHLSHVSAKGLLLAALLAPSLFAFLPTITGVSLRHLHDSGGALHHSLSCKQTFEFLASLGKVGGGIAGLAMNGLAWLLILVGFLLFARLIWATVRLERGIVPYLNSPSSRLAAALARVKGKIPELEGHRFHECAIPPGLSSVMGFFRVRCVLSRQFVEDATEEEIDAVIAHEASHVRARDVVVTFIVGALNCVFFFLRPVRLLGREWREAAELAADDAAVAATQNPLGMAAAILKVTGAAPQTIERGVLPLPAVALPFADEAACPPSKRVERLITQAEQAALVPQAEPRIQVVGGWILTGVLTVFGAALLMSAEAACVSHCTLEAVARLL